MKNLFILLVCSLFTVMTSLEIQAQNQSQDHTLGNMGGLVSITTPLDIERRRAARQDESSEVKGNPLLFEQWNTKGIVYSDGKSLRIDSLNYNMYSEEIGTPKEKDSFFTYDTQFIDSVKIDNIKLHKLDGKFYVLLQTGSKASLYKKYETIIQGRRLVIKDDYYVLSGGKLIKLKPPKHGLEDVFGHHTDAKNELKKANLDSVKIDNIKLHKLDGDFYVVLQTGSKASLYKKYETRIQGRRLVIKDDYYVLSGGKLIKLKASKNGFENVFGDQAVAMKKIMKSEKLSYKKQEDLIHIFESFNSL